VTASALSSRRMTWETAGCVMLRRFAAIVMLSDTATSMNTRNDHKSIAERPVTGGCSTLRRRLEPAAYQWPNGGSACNAACAHISTMNAGYKTMSSHCYFALQMTLLRTHARQEAVVKAAGEARRPGVR